MLYPWIHVFLIPNSGLPGGIFSHLGSYAEDIAIYACIESKPDRFDTVKIQVI